MKYLNKEVSVKVVKEVENKVKLIKTSRGHAIEKALISPYGPEQALQELDYFHHILTLEDLFQI